MRDLDQPVGVSGLNRSNELLKCRSASLAIDTVGVVHEDDVVRNSSGEDRVEFGTQAVGIAEASAPAIVAGIQPPQTTLMQLCQQHGYGGLTVAIDDLHMRVLPKALLRTARQARVKFDRNKSGGNAD